MPVSAARRQEDHHHRRPRRRTACCTRCRRPGSSTTCRSAATASRGMIMAVAGAAQGQAEAHRRRHRRGDHQHLPLRHLPAGARGDPRRRQGLRRDDHEIHTRRSTAAPSSSAPPPSAAASRSACDLPFGGPQVRARRRLARDQRLGRDPPGRHRRHPHRALRDGPGHAHRPRADGRRRARVRLVEGHAPNIRRPARTSRASASGATSPPAAAAASASRTSTCARAAPRRA